MTSPTNRSWLTHVRAWFRTWWPVIVCVLVIVRESSASFSGAHTSRFLRPLWMFFFGPVQDVAWDNIHLVLRKTGHFVWYGLTGLAFLRAWRLQWSGYQMREKLLQRAVVMAFACTALVASCDELHQSYLADRTGQVSDVLLDSAGAFLMLSIAWIRLRRPSRAR